MQQIKDNVQALLDQYRDELAACGVAVFLSKRYVESAVQERGRSYANAAGAIFGAIDRAADRKQEIRYQYNNEPNKYHSLLLTLRPIDKTLLPREECREYAFLLRKRERPHIGVAPEDKSYSEAKIYARIEKRLQKILKRARTQPPQKVCRDTVADAFRYTLTPKYEYKQTVLGKDRLLWDILFCLLAAASVVGLLVLCWGIRELFR